MNEKTLISFDYAIKYLLKHKADYDIVEGFISAIISSCGYPPVKINALLEGTAGIEDIDISGSIADLIVEDLSGVKYLIEIYRIYTDIFLYKRHFNSCRLISDNVYGSDDYSTIKKIIHINLAYFDFQNIKTPLHYGKNVFYKMDKNHPKDLHLANMGLVFFDLYNIFPEHIVISIPLFDDIIKGELDEWLYVMKNRKVGDNFKSPYMQKIKERLAIFKMTPSDRNKYHEYRNISLKQRDYTVAAVALGIEQGRKEAKEKIEIAQKMLESNLPLEIISQCSDLTIDEIKKLL